MPTTKKRAPKKPTTLPADLAPGAPAPRVGMRPTRDMLALAVTLGHAKQLTLDHGTPDDWDALTRALLAEHTPEQLANMLTGAAALIVRMTGGRGAR